jgi:hypothetical protein
MVQRSGKESGKIEKSSEKRKIRQCRGVEKAVERRGKAAQRGG